MALSAISINPYGKTGRGLCESCRRDIFGRTEALAQVVDAQVVLLQATDGLVSVAIEAKTGEPFNKTLAEWLAAGVSANRRPARLRQLQEVLGLTAAMEHHLRYQLLHRTAVAILEARPFNARNELLLVQSFADDRRTARQV